MQWETLKDWSHLIWILRFGYGTTSCLHRSQVLFQSVSGWSSSNSASVSCVAIFCKVLQSLKIVYPFLPNGFADHYPYFLWLFHWGYTPFSDIPKCCKGYKVQGLQSVTMPCFAAARRVLPQASRHMAQEPRLGSHTTNRSKILKNKIYRKKTTKISYVYVIHVPIQACQNLIERKQSRGGPQSPGGIESCPSTRTRSIPAPPYIICIYIYIHVNSWIPVPDICSTCCRWSTRLCCLPTFQGKVKRIAVRPDFSFERALEPMFHWRSNTLKLLWGYLTL